MAKKKFYMMIDTETCGTLECAFTYDIGIAVIDKKGQVYAQYSFVIAEVFFGMQELMKTAYYANKIPAYWRDIETKRRTVARFMTVYQIVRALCKKYNITAIIAHNMRFDYNALNNTLQTITNNQLHRFFPYKVEIWCTLAMARNIITNKPAYISFCKNNNFLTNNGMPRATAEVLYRYIINDINFIEAHTGIDDVMIEKEIFAYIMRQHKAVRKTYWKK